MLINDPIADMLTRVRNAIKARKKTVEMPATNFKVRLAELMIKTGFIKEYSVTEEQGKKTLKIALKYVDGVSAISGLERVSTPGLHIYKGSKEVPRVLNGLGVSVISTSRGLMTDKQAKKENVGGELICYIW